MSEPLLVIGNGMATARFVDELATRALGRHAVAVVGEEPRLAYNRVLLSSVLAGAVPLPRSSSSRRIGGPTAASPCSMGTVQCDRPRRTPRPPRRRRHPALRAPRARHRLETDPPHGAGERPARGPDLPGSRRRRRVAAAAAKGTSAVVIGGGLLGLEAAYGLARAGVKVGIVHLMDRLMERQLDARSAAMLKQAIERQGVSVHLGAQTAAIRGDRRAEAVELADGQLLPADLVVMAVGIRPNTELAASAGLNVNRGIVVDDGLQTSLPASTRSASVPSIAATCYGLVEPAYEQAQALARRLAGQPAPGTPAACSPPTSRCPACTCSRPATSSAVRAPTRSCSPIRGSASTRTGSRRRSSRRRRALWRYHGWAVVPRPDPLRYTGQRPSRQPHVRARPRGTHGGMMADRTRSPKGFMNAPPQHPPAIRTTCPYCGVGAACWRRPTARGGAAIAGDPTHPPISAGSAPRARRSARRFARRPAAPPDRRQPMAARAHRLGYGARSVADGFAQRHRSATAPTPSHSISPASC